MSEKVYLRILQGGLVASLIVVFLVFEGLLFPYITSKQLSFNILMELLLGIWLVFILRYPTYRPKKNFITIGLVAYFAAILASIAVSVNPGLSFWGDAERMLGLFHLLHFLIFYLILISVFRTEAQWHLLLASSVAVATAVSIYGIFGANVYTTIGNTAYVSGYLIFNIFFAAILFYRARTGAWRWLYLPAIALMLIEFALARTSGAIIGLGASVLLMFFLFGLLHRDAKKRRLSLVVFLVAVLGILAIFSQSGSAWFQDSFLRGLTFQKHTFQTRLISWRGAANDFGNHWLFGTGFGNYAIIFDRHFDPEFFNYATVETYFDRAHNNLIDIASTTGLVGLLTYLSIFGAAGYYLVRRFRGGSENTEVILIVGLLTAYFIQNLAVFDSYVTYLGLMLILGYIYWLSREGDGEIAEDGGEEAASHRLTIGVRSEFTVLVCVLAVLAIVCYQYNLRVWTMYRGVISGYTEILEGKLATGVLTYQKALSGTPLDQDGRVTLVNLLTANPKLLETLDKERAALILEYGITLARENVESNPFDSLTQMQLAQIFDTAARYHYQDLELFNHYSRQAIEAIDYAIESSPRRVPTHIVKAQMLLARGETDEAISTLEYAISLNPDYYEAYCRLAQFYFFLEASVEDESAKYAALVAEPLGRCVDLGGAAEINSPTLLAQALNFYAPLGDYGRSLKLAERLVSLNPYDAKSWLNLAKLNLIAGRIDAAEEAAGQAFLLDNQTRAEWQTFLEAKPPEEAGNDIAVACEEEFIIILTPHQGRFVIVK